MSTYIILYGMKVDMSAEAYFMDLYLVYSSGVSERSNYSEDIQ